MPSPKSFTVDVIDVLDTVLVRVCGEADLATAPQLATALERVEHRRCELDLSQVTFADSTILGLLVGHHRRAGAQGGTVRLVGASRPVCTILNITGVAHLFWPDTGPPKHPRPS
ncbi:STAS domain-containing protein [Streptomyces flavofungini]|uniref:Anti-sigma factor antagonist n=1 Tax=Streptomyces flavofungini TaxID=68200 RepID=A0ABS0XET0_9ACTN|nr:STAS domain-containing protein [Streptomyces flavofungini]